MTEIKERTCYKNGQIWEASWPMCWTVKLHFVDVREDQSLFMVEEITEGRVGMFHRDYNDPPYLFTPDAIDKLLGEKRKLNA
jgi:hypothetical protein